MVETSTPIEIFCSYAHEDEIWLRKLETHLSLLKRQGLISFWHNRLVAPGTDWAKTIDTHLETASVILLLVSADFFASDYCYGVEMKRALERQAAREIHVIPILVRSIADWTNTPFAHLQILPTNAKPIALWRNKDDALSDVVAGLRRVLRDLLLLTNSTPHAISPAIWNIPYQRNPFFTGRHTLLMSLRSQLDQNTITALTQTKAISGLGGIGKTQIALEYAYRYGLDQQKYTYILWVSAATSETLLTDVANLAHLLKISLQNEQDQRLIALQVKQWLMSHKDWLLILDNADNLELIADYLPLRNSPNGHILITTRTQATGDIAEVVAVDAMESEEGMLLLLRRAKVLAYDSTLDIISPTLRAEAEALVVLLGGLPLALDQAGAYIEETGTSFSNYLNLYQTRRKELLERRTHLYRGYFETVATTWAVSFQRVKQANRISSDLLQLCSFLAPDDIPEAIITNGAKDLGNNLKKIKNDNEKLDEAIEELLRYSLIKRNREKNSLSIHRLVQAVVRENLPLNLQRLWSMRAVQVMSAIFPAMHYDIWSQM